MTTNEVAQTIITVDCEEKFDGHQWLHVSVSRKDSHCLHLWTHMNELDGRMLPEFSEVFAEIGRSI